MRQQQNRLGDVIDLVLGQARLIVVDERDDVAAGDVAIIDDGETGRGRSRGEWGRARPRGIVERMVRAVEHARERQVVDVFRGAGDFGVGVLPPNVLANGASHETTLTDIGRRLRAEGPRRVAPEGRRQSWANTRVVVGLLHPDT